jgi:hypothetical protein
VLASDVLNNEGKAKAYEHIDDSGTSTSDHDDRILLFCPHICGCIPAKKYITHENVELVNGYTVCTALLAPRCVARHQANPYLHNCGVNQNRSSICFPLLEDKEQWNKRLKLLSKTRNKAKSKTKYYLYADKHDEEAPLEKCIEECLQKRKYLGSRRSTRLRRKPDLLRQYQIARCLLDDVIDNN